MSNKLLVALLALSAHALVSAKPENLTLDPNHTKPVFAISHLGFSTTRGFFKDTHGTLMLDNEAHAAKLDATIATASIDTGIDKLDEHLKSKDFFDVAKYPTIIVKADKFTFDGDKPTKAEGTMTMLGVTQPVTLNIAFNKCAKRMVDGVFDCGAEVSATIQRSAWGMKTYIPFVGDDVQISVQVEAVRQ